MRRLSGVVFFIGFTVGFTVGLCSAQAQNANTNWLKNGSNIEDTNTVAEYITSDTSQIRFGRLLFNSPLIMGEKALRLGISCNSCHTNGHINSSFFIPGLSGKPGTIDLSTRFWNAKNENGKNDPVAIPSLRDLKNTAPYGSEGHFNTIPDIVRHVAENEFDGPALTRSRIQALTAYLSALRFPTTTHKLPRRVKTADGDRLYPDNIALLSDAINLLKAAIFSDGTGDKDLLIQLIRWQSGNVVKLSQYSGRKDQFRDFVKRLPSLVNTSPDDVEQAFSGFLKILHAPS